ncbi:MAG: Protein GrpE [Candidatus Argoarchaeum ethanivorans]|uniref:Protein GrpE n=1 Tax=Candidatus Argoarchaeum ethanivorans TaxID=2608793 RepID=A0A811ZZU4_9EURY|nr:MAG: Protein GrpE [Candidatus Argoarchaeum ethanivorans]
MKENEIVVVSKKEMDEKDELITSLKTKAEKMKSDFSRYKERYRDEEKEIRRKASSELVKQLLSVADTLERAMYSSETGDGCEVVERMVEGTKNNLGMTYNQLLNALGVIPIAPLEGERFNDELHTAIETTQKPLLPDKTILSLVRKGYMIENELIRPAEVVISRGGGELEASDVKMEVKSKTDGSKLLRRFWLKVFKQEFEELEGQKQKLEGRLREIGESEEVLQMSVKEFDAEREKFKKKVGEWTKRKEEAEPEVNKLEQRKKVLTAELEEIKKQLSVIHTKSNELNLKKDKIVVESIALGNYNEKLLEEREKLLNDLEELNRKKESLDAELNEIEEKIALSSEEQMRMEEKKARSADELSSVEEELQRAKESLNKELMEIHEIEQRKETLILEIEEAKGQINTTHEDLNELNLKKDKILIESIALIKYNKELLEKQGNH